MDNKYKDYVATLRDYRQEGMDCEQNRQEGIDHEQKHQPESAKQEKEGSRTTMDFTPDPETGFPEPAVAGDLLESLEDQNAYDKVVEKAMTITQPWPWRETDGMSHAEWQQYARDLLTDPALSLCLTPWREKPQPMSNEMLEAVDLVVWIAGMSSAHDIMGGILKAWFMRLSQDDPTERVLRCQKAFTILYEHWNTRHCVASLPVWIRKSAHVERKAARPVSAMMHLELFCQFAFAAPSFVRAELRNIRRSILDVDVARDHMLTIVQRVARPKKLLTCRKTMTLFMVTRVFADVGASERLYSGHGPFHHIVYKYAEGADVTEKLEEDSDSHTPLLLKSVAASKKRKRDGSDDEDNVLALPRLPCGCCPVSVGSTLLGWIRTWLEPGMYIFETALHDALPQFATWQPHMFESFSKETDHTNPSKFRIQMQTTPASRWSSASSVKVEKGGKSLWVWTATKLDECSDSQRVRLCDDDFGFRFEPRYGGTGYLTLPLVGFAPAYVALLARREVVRLTGMPYDLANIVYEYVKCNI